MRLEVLEHGHRLPARVFQRVAASLLGAEVDDVVKTMMHRPEFFGRHLNRYVNQVLRGPSYWTAGEREYMAAITSGLNECLFCATAHSETTRVESRGELDVSDDTTPRPQLTATCDLLAKITHTPDEVTKADIDVVRATGVPDDAIVDALHVNLIFNLVNRLANTFGWSWDSETQIRKAAQVIHLSRYKLPGFVLR
ncbi:hypothetical protein [Actinocrispum sp. NPDC049592]|uniref:hypothetical protein n=1 Tax=Actinocrispum sp. NPDC049592 TaxID=3154835 RepID=UPI0034483564